MGRLRSPLAQFIVHALMVRDALARSRGKQEGSKMPPRSKLRSFDRSKMSLELQRAVAKAEECAKLAGSATNAEDRAYYQRMHRKWVGITEGWRTIAGIDKTQR